MLRTPPSHFVQKLKAINPHFSVKWDNRREVWSIEEGVRHSQQVAELNGAAVFRLRRRPESALRFKELGTKVLDYVRRNDPRRYLSVPHMVEALGIDKGKNPLAQL